MELKYPNMRNEVVFALTSLSDRAYQQRVWIDRITPRPTYYDDLDHQVHTLFDDIDVCVEPDRWVGVVLYPGEVEPLRKLGASFQEVIWDLGDVTDAEYLAHPQWDEVIGLARIALATMTGIDPDDLVAELG